MVLPSQSTSLSEMDAYLRTVAQSCEVVNKSFGHVPDAALFFGRSMPVPERYVSSEKSLDYSSVPGFSFMQDKDSQGVFISSFNAGDTSFFALKSIDVTHCSCSLMDMVFPVRLMGALGVKTIVLINSCISLDEVYKEGDLCLIEDHINFLGTSPLVGANIDRWGPRFPDMTEPYDPELRALMVEKANSSNIYLHKCIFGGVNATMLDKDEARFLNQIGAGIAGSGFVGEVIAARHMGLRVLALSVVVPDLQATCAVPATLQQLIDAIAPML